jgi:hypothetical protein
LEQVPRGLKVAGGIADVEAGEVDHRRQATVDHQQVARQQVAVDPDLRAVPRRGVERLLPGAEGGPAVDPVAELGDRPTNLLVAFHEWSAWTTGRTGMGASRVDPAQRVHEPGEVDGRLLQILDRAVGVLAGQPFVHRPVEGIALGRMPSRQLHRNSQRQVRGELGQPLRFHRRLLGGPADAWQPSGQVVTEPVDVVVGPVGGDRIDRQIGPVRELYGEQASHECDVGVDLVGMHPDPGHRRHHGEPR